MKKRYVASPLLLLAIAAAWNITLRAHTPVATAEAVQTYTSPKVMDLRHPIDVFYVSLDGGETENEVIAKLPTTVYPEDRVHVILAPEWGLPTIVQVERALPVTIQDGHITLTARTFDNTVGDLLNDLHRPLADLDTANYKSSDTLVQNMTIKITRVAVTTMTQTEVIPFDTVTKDDPTQYRGTNTVQTQGKNGVRTKTYKVRREDGVVVSNTLVNSVVTTVPVSKVVLQGSKLKIGKTATGQATWYDSNITQVAANIFPKGTLLRLTYQGRSIFATVDDTGGFGPQTVVDLNPKLFQQLCQCDIYQKGRLSGVLAEQVLNP